MGPRAWLEKLKTTFLRQLPLTKSCRKSQVSHSFYDGTGFKQQLDRTAAIMAVEAAKAHVMLKRDAHTEAKEIYAVVLKKKKARSAGGGISEVITP